MNLPERREFELLSLRREPAADALDVIFIEGLVAETVIGIDASEKHLPQPVRIDLALGIPRAAACRTDRIGDTIDYGEVRTALLELLRSHHVRLLEALAEEIAQLVLLRFDAHWTRVAVAKPNKFPDLAAVGVTIERRRPALQRPAAVLSLIGAGMVPDAESGQR